MDDWEQSALELVVAAGINEKAGRIIEFEASNGSVGRQTGCEIQGECIERLAITRFVVHFKILDAREETEVVR